MGGHFIETLILVLIGLAIFGPKTLQSIARSAGRGVGQAKEMKDKIAADLRVDELNKISESVPRNPGHAVKMLMTQEKAAPQQAPSQKSSEELHTVEEPQQLS